MKFIRQNDSSLNILVSDEDDYDVTDDNGVDVVLSQEQVQELKGVLCASHNIATMRDKFPSSGDLLLIAHDEWKRRQEKKDFDDEIPWISGWISGYLTSKKFVDERLIKLRTPAPGQP